jgi:hypothetical protein
MTKTKAQQIVSRLLQTPEASSQLKILWAQINGDATITTQARNSLKIGSIARFVMGQSRALDVDPSKVADVIRGLKGQKCPKTYIEELRKFLPELSDTLLHLKTASEIDSTFKRVA